MKPVSLALIPARAGSKRLADKMLRRLGGRTLVEWTVDAVLSSGVFDRVVVSSDSEAILEPVVNNSRVEPRLRPAELASDTATTMEVLLDFLRSPNRHSLHPAAAAARDAAQLTPDSLVALCQPPTPFRSAEDVRGTVARLVPGIDAAIAVTAAPIPPQRSFTLSADGVCEIADDSPLKQGITRQQLFAPMFTPNGAIYVSRAGVLLEHGSFFTGRVAGYVMPRERSIDIDDEIDWQVAEALLRGSQRS